MNDSGIKMEVHLIQNFAPSNLNRDDTGQPKSAFFGGFRRARISSQCTKRSARQLWRKGGPVVAGFRSKLLKTELAARLGKEGRTDEQIETALTTFLTQFYSKMDNKDSDKTAVLLFVSDHELDVSTQAIDRNWAALSHGNEIAKSAADIVTGEIKSATTSADIALFGRMLAEQPGRNTDGACQVAHPISTHRVDMEMDFYTAVDDLNPAGETGAGMMGVVGFNSACYYRYALLDRDQLARNLARKTDSKNGKWFEELTDTAYDEADKVIEAFLKAMVYAIPTGKQNSFSAQNLPSFGLFVRRQGGVPISLANAFAKPVRATTDDDDLVGLSVAALTKHWDAVQECYGKQGVQETACFHLEQSGRLNGLGSSDKGSVANAIDAVMPVKSEAR